MFYHVWLTVSASPDKEPLLDPPQLGVEGSLAVHGGLEVLHSHPEL